ANDQHDDADDHGRAQKLATAIRREAATQMCKPVAFAPRDSSRGQSRGQSRGVSQRHHIFMDALNIEESRRCSKTLVGKRIKSAVFQSTSAVTTDQSSQRRQCAHAHEATTCRSGPAGSPAGPLRIERLVRLVAAAAVRRESCKRERCEGAWRRNREDRRVARKLSRRLDAVGPDAER
ncbi:MAG: hypothetical protein RLY72_1392, partial [Planctomycetota bacterium]